MNQRPLRPERSALPSCATPRHSAPKIETGSSQASAIPAAPSDCAGATRSAKGRRAALSPGDGRCDQANSHRERLFVQDAAYSFQHFPPGSRILERSQDLRFVGFQKHLQCNRLFSDRERLPRGESGLAFAHSLRNPSESGGLASLAAVLTSEWGVVS